jgi:two-component system sensor histidine kinase/response regulator
MAHTIKGVAGNLGAMELFPAAAQLEKAIKDGERASFDTLLDNLDSCLNLVLSGIEELERQEAARKAQEEPAGEVSIDIDIDKVKPLLVEMADLLESDLTTAMTRLDALREQLGESVVSAQFKELEHHVNGFDTDSALRSVKAIAQALDISFEPG